MKTDNKGFTLVELVAVVAIMLTLATIATVAVTGILSKNRNDTKKVGEEQILKAARMYIIEDIGSDSNNIKCSQQNKIKSDILNKYTDSSVTISSNECVVATLDSNCNITSIAYKNSGC